MSLVAMQKPANGECSMFLTSSLSLDVKLCLGEVDKRDN